MGGVFVYAGYAKLLDPVENFRGLLADYTVIPYVFIPAIALTFPWLELLSGSLLILGLFTRVNALILGFLSFSFAGVLLISKWKLGISPESCGCFGQTGIQLSTAQVMVLDAVNIFIGLSLYRMKRHLWTVDTWFHERAS